MKRLLLCMTATAWLLSGCATNRPDEAQDLHFVFITTCAEAEFFLPVRKGAHDAAEMMGVACDFIGTPGVDIPAQVEMVRQALDDGYDGIALNVIDPEAFDAVVREAAGRNVPVVAFNVDDHATDNARLAAVCQMLYAAGRTLGEQAAGFVPDGSRILMTLHDEGVSALDDRLRGAQDVLKERGVTWRVVVTGNEAGADIVAKALRDEPKIRAVLCTGQADTAAAGLAIEKEFAASSHAAAGFDLSPEILRLIRAGHIRFTIDQQPYVQGFYPVIQLTLLRRHGIQPSSIDAGAGIIDRRNVDNVIAQCRQGYR